MKVYSAFSQSPFLATRYCRGWILDILKDRGTAESFSNEPVSIVVARCGCLNLATKPFQSLWLSESGMSSNAHHETLPEEVDCAATVRDGDLVLKRENYLSWEDYFMAVAFLSAQRSKDPSSQIGACIVNDERKVQYIFSPSSYAMCRPCCRLSSRGLLRLGCC